MDYCWYGQTRLKQDEVIVDSVGLVCVTRERLWITAQLAGAEGRCKTKGVRVPKQLEVTSSISVLASPPHFHTRCITYSYEHFPMLLQRYPSHLRAFRTSESIYFKFPAHNITTGIFNPIPMILVLSTISGRV